MKKLNLESLVVESFATTPVPHARGTVVGREDTYDANCTSTCVTVDPACPATDPAGNSCGAVCNYNTYGPCSGAITCNAQSCAGQCGTGGGTHTYAPMQTCDPYVNTCANPCMV